MKAFFGSAVEDAVFFHRSFRSRSRARTVQISCIFCGAGAAASASSRGGLSAAGLKAEWWTLRSSKPSTRKRVEMGREPAYDTRKIAGFAFGMGVDRIAMMK